MLDYFIQNGKCGAEIAFSIVASKWAPSIIRACFMENGASFSTFKRLLPEISDSTLARQLKNLSANDMLEKTSNPALGEKLFTLTQKGLDILPIMSLMQGFAAGADCGVYEYDSAVEYTKRLIGSKWKARIIWIIYHCSVARTNELHHAIEGISFKVLQQQLGDLERNGLVERKAFEGRTPHVEFSLTERGKEAYLVIQSLANWCRAYDLIKARIIVDY